MCNHNVPCWNLFRNSIEYHPRAGQTTCWNIQDVQKLTPLCWALVYLIFDAKILTQLCKKKWEDHVTEWPTLVSGKIPTMNTKAMNLYHQKWCFSDPPLAVKDITLACAYHLRIQVLMNGLNAWVCIRQNELYTYKSDSAIISCMAFTVCPLNAKFMHAIVKAAQYCQKWPAEQISHVTLWCMMLHIFLLFCIFFFYICNFYIHSNNTAMSTSEFVCY